MRSDNLGRLTRAVAAATVAIALLASCSGSGARSDALPDETLELLDGGEYELTQTGEARALNLWATWCAPCRAELPAFDAVAARVNGVEIIGVNTGDTGDAASALVEELGLSFTQILDPRASVQTTLRITGMPATILVDAQGDIVDIHNGELTEGELEELLAEHFDVSFDRQ